MFSLVLYKFNRCIINNIQKTNLIVNNKTSTYTFILILQYAYKINIKKNN